MSVPGNCVSFIAGKMSGIPGKWESGTANPNHMLLELTFIDFKINDVDDSAVHSESNS